MPKLHSPLTLCERRRDPFPACPRVCSSGTCLFRYHAERLLRDEALTELFDAAMAEAARTGAWSDLRALEQAGERVGRGLPPATRRSIALCYGVQQLAGKRGLSPAARALATEHLLAGYDGRGAAAEALLTTGKGNIAGEHDDDTG